MMRVVSHGFREKNSYVKLVLKYGRAKKNLNENRVGANGIA